MCIKKKPKLEMVYISQTAIGCTQQLYFSSERSQTEIVIRNCQVQTTHTTTYNKPSAVGYNAIFLMTEHLQTFEAVPQFLDFRYYSLFYFHVKARFLKKLNCI